MIYSVPEDRIVTNVMATWCVWSPSRPTRKEMFRGRRESGRGIELSPAQTMKGQKKIWGMDGIAGWCSQDVMGGCVLGQGTRSWRGRGPDVGVFV